MQEDRGAETSQNDSKQKEHLFLCTKAQSTKCGHQTASLQRRSCLSDAHLEGMLWPNIHREKHCQAAALTDPLDSSGLWSLFQQRPWQPLRNSNQRLGLALTTQCQNLSQFPLPWPLLSHQTPEPSLLCPAFYPRPARTPTSPGRVCWATAPARPGGGAAEETITTDEPSLGPCSCSADEPRGVLSRNNAIKDDYLQWHCECSRVFLHHSMWHRILCASLEFQTSKSETFYNTVSASARGTGPLLMSSKSLSLTKLQCPYLQKRKKRDGDRGRWERKKKREREKENKRQ